MVGHRPRSDPPRRVRRLRTGEELVAPAALFAMLYLRYIAEDSDSWDETQEHESTTTREEELIRDTGSAIFASICSERPGKRWNVLQTLTENNDAPRLLPARKLTLEEMREFVDLRIEGWLRTLPEPLFRDFRREWTPLRELDSSALTLTAIERMLELELLRGSKGA